MKRLLTLATMTIIGIYAGSVLADVPGRALPSGIVPNPGTQQKELPNITAPGTYNVFEFPNFCAGCHGGTLDQNNSHYGNWAGSNMANSGRDPFFRTNNLIVNADAYYITGGGLNGVGNICWRCHSPNGWYSSRLDETQGGKIDGTTIEQSLVKSTDMQGISCEFCHRTIGNVTFKRPDLVANGFANDPAWLLLAGATDWPHIGNPYPEGPVAGNPYGDTTFQFNDGKVYQADLPGNQLLFWSDVPTSGNYTGQTYGFYPPGFAGGNLVGQTPFGQPVTNLLGDVIAYLPNGQSKLQFEQSVNPPTILDPVTGQLVANYEESSISPRHTTHMGGSTQDGLTASGNRYLPTAEMCGTCHDLTVPTLNSGMPEQRTYTEWKYSRFGRTGFICQDCHMGEIQHESKDGMAGTFKADPEKAGYFPYAKPRPASAIHKFSPANRDLGSMLAWLNPEVDLEVTGKPSGDDTRTNNGVLSSRTETYARQTRNGELKLRDAARIEIVQQPTLVSGNVYEVKVKVTNLTGHSFPSGYPDGRRAFVTLNVSDATGAPVYQSGFYDAATADLLTSAGVPFKRAQSPVIDATVPGNNAVMVYEKKTGSPNGDGTYKMGESLLNPVIVFDNRLHPAGWTAEFESAGVRLVNYTGTDAAAVPFNEPTRYGTLTNPRLDGLGGPNDAGAHWDVITYRFTSATSPTNARAEIFYQSHARDFVEYLKDRNNQESDKDVTGDPSFPARPATLGGPKPEGTPSINEVNYPFTPNYLGDNINVTTLTDLNGQSLQNNWGGVMYAAWLATGKGAPFSIDAADTTQVAAPAAPTVTAVSLTPFKNQISWGAVAGAEKYVVLVRYGTSGTNNIWGVDPVTGLGLPNASWDRLAIVQSPATSFDHVVKPGKTYGYMVYAVNDATFSDPLNDQILEFNFGLGGADAVTGTLETVAFSAPVEVTTPGATPTEPKNLSVAAVTTSSVTLKWYDQAIDETGFIVERQLVNPNGSRGAFVALPVIASQTPGATGIGYNSWTDTTVAAGTTYNYRVQAVNGTVSSVFSDIKSARTSLAVPTAPSALRASAITATYVILNWTDTSTIETGFYVERSANAGLTWTRVATAAANTVSFRDSRLVTKTAYQYRVQAFNANGISPLSNTLLVTTK